MNWLASLSPKRNISLSRREQTLQYFSMYRGKRNKFLLNTRDFKIIQIKDELFIEVRPLMGTSVIFLEDKEGTKICLVRKDKVINEFIHPFIKPSMIIDKGGLIPDLHKERYSKKFKKDFDIEFYDESTYNKLNAVEKLYYVEKTWDLSHTLVYKLLI